jgi:hypothetical protein
MKEDPKERVKKYLSSLKELFSELKQWAEQDGLSVLESEVVIDEPRPGKYKASKLTVFDPEGKAMAEVVPIGAWIIGADWRVDVVGHLESENLVYWASGAPEVEPAYEHPAFKDRNRLFKGASESGWYWIESKRLGRAKPLDKELFMDLIWVVKPL